MENKLNKIIKEKGNICVALDYRNTNDIINKLNLLGNDVGIFKLHCDIIENFNTKFIEDLLLLKKKYNFLLWEDRKFSDIGFITNQQLHYGVYKISLWADIISSHSTCGIKSIPQTNNLIVFLVIELSVSQHLCNNYYIEESVKIANTHPNVLGVVCQHNPKNLNKNILKIVPGISLNANSDNYNQKYNRINNKEFADIYVVGRSITTSQNPMETLKKLKNISTNNM